MFRIKRDQHLAGYDVSDATIIDGESLFPKVEFSVVWNRRVIVNHVASIF
ncbi:hypothetical protein [Persicitalea jodogahamensis]|nr:hypothetical protein [Persicitalea jodogahamensis]